MIEQRYLISHADGRPVHPEAEYFVLRLDDKGDEKHVAACRLAIQLYGQTCGDKSLREDILDHYGECDATVAVGLIEAVIEMCSDTSKEVDTLSIEEVLVSLKDKIESCGEVSAVEWILIKSYLELVR